MSRSIVIIGKGPSVRYSTKQFIDSFDDVAICNFPPMEKYQRLISNRAKYHFLNAGDYLPYSREFISNLGLTHIFNTSRHSKESNDKFLPGHDVKYVGDYGIAVKKKYEEKYGFWPSTGVMAFDYFLNNDEYSTICLVGFDFFNEGDDVYYFPRSETNSSLHHLWNNTQYSSTGKVLSASYNGHGGDRAKETIRLLIEDSSKNISLLTERITD